MGHAGLQRKGHAMPSVAAVADRTLYYFAPNYSVIAVCTGQASIHELADEIGVYSATPDFVRANCGPIARRVLDLVPSWYYDEARALGLWPNCDIRIHRLYPGDYPAYPGWHCDGEFRETYFSQPDLDRIPVSRHLTLTVSSDPNGVSNTQFLTVPFTATVDRPAADVSLWGQVHQQLGAQDALWDSTDGELVCFDARTLHRAMPARVRGWRMFFRMSMWHRPNLGEGGCITKQEQVYKVVEGSGW